MEIKQLTPFFSVYLRNWERWMSRRQRRPHEVLIEQFIRSFKTLINNRPDDEAAEAQPASATLAAAAERSGID